VRPCLKTKKGCLELTVLHLLNKQSLEPRPQTKFNAK
jgi:hypothetical protein